MLYLASSSPRRRRILRQMGVSFRLLKPDYRERPLPGAGPAALVKAHALAKAVSAVRPVRSGIVLGADTVVFYEGCILGKPGNLRAAHRMLGRLQGRWHRVYTGVALLEVLAGRVCKKRVFFEVTRVKLRKMSRAEMGRYFRLIRPLDKAGAYAIQSSGVKIVDAVRGSVWNAAGLPAETLAKALNTFRAKN